MGGHHRGQRWPHGGFCPRAHPEGKAQEASGQERGQDQAGHDAPFLHPARHVSKHEDSGKRGLALVHHFIGKIFIGHPRIIFAGSKANPVDVPDQAFNSLHRRVLPSQSNQPDGSDRDEKQKSGTDFRVSW